MWENCLATLYFLHQCNNAVQCVHLFKQNKHTTLIEIRGSHDGEC